MFLDVRLLTPKIITMKIHFELEIDIKQMVKLVLAITVLLIML